MTAVDQQPLLPVTETPGPRRARRRRWSSLPLVGKAKPLHVVLTIFLYAFFAVFLIWPILQVVATGFLKHDGGFTFDYVLLIFQDPVLVRGLVNAGVVAVLVTLLTLAMFPVLVVMYVRLAISEQRDSEAAFGDAWRAYAAVTPRFWPRLGNRLPGGDAPVKSH